MRRIAPAVHFAMKDMNLLFMVQLRFPIDFATVNRLNTRLFERG